MNLRFDCQFDYASGFALNAAFETEQQVTGLSGPSGSGKTTVLLLIAGLLRPKQGSIYLDTQPLAGPDAAFVPPEKRRIGMMFQEHRLFPHMNVRRNIGYGIPVRQDDRQIKLDDVLEVLELGNLQQRFPRELSGGEKQRVALARAIATSPRLLLLDEPLSSVEADLRERISGFIETVVGEFQIPTILVTHHQELISRLAAEVIQIDQGSVVPAGH